MSENTTRLLHSGSDVMNSFLAKLFLGVLCLCLAPEALRAQTTIIDGEGFESPAYSTTFDGDGKLEGQAAKLPNDAPFPGFQAWLASIGTTSTAVVQSSIFESGSQAVRVDRAANEAVGGGRWAPPVNGWPSERFVCIEWDMYVEDAGGPSGSFGPFFGVEAYDDDGVGASNGLMGSFGVDATTGDVLYQATGTGFLTETGSTVNFNEWNSFLISLDYLTHEYTVSLNGSALVTEPFVDGAGLDEFTDAPLATFAAAGDSVSLGLTGTAYFDNYLVSQKVPEPGTIVLLLASLAAMPWTSGRNSR